MYVRASEVATPNSARVRLHASLMRSCRVHEGATYTLASMHGLRMSATLMHGPGANVVRACTPSQALTTWLPSMRMHVGMLLNALALARAMQINAQAS